MNNLTGTAIAAACVLAPVAPAAAQAQVAIVQDVSSKTAGVEFMDYVAIGRQIRLGPRDSIVLEYMQSCWRETITGGQVTIGTELSDVNAGQVERHKVDCDGGRLMLTSMLASQSAGLVVRAMRPQGKGAPPAPQITLYGLSPLVELKGGGKLVIERVDQPGERYEYKVGGEQNAPISCSHRRAGSVDPADSPSNAFPRAKASRDQTSLRRSRAPLIWSTRPPQRPAGRSQQQ
jgi:hypothetical protein